MEGLSGKRVLVIGCGKSGIAAANLLYVVSAIPVFYDDNEALDKEGVREKLVEGVTPAFLSGPLGEEQIRTFALAVASPGVPTDSPLVSAFMQNKIPVWGEVELAYRFSKGRVIAITGTNGKTTVTTLVGEIMKAYYPSVFVVGNIGSPYTEASLQMTDDSVTVAEISSFQLETAHQFYPAVSAILNITPDHLNRHHTMDNYVAIKESVAKNQRKTDFCILNEGDPYTRSFAKRCPAQAILFSSRGRLEEGYYLEGEEIWRCFGGRRERLLPVKDMKLIGIHNYENVMAAIAVSAAFGVPMEHILSVVKTFPGVEHRIEFVADKKGVLYYNDSKATNPDAAIRGIRAMSRPTILIGGGYDKENTYDQWIESFEGRVKLLVLIGQTKEKIAACARKHGMNAIAMAESFEEAMELCVNSATKGDAVLLSPACASWGMFPNYEVRGKLFKEFVNRIEE